MVLVGCGASAPEPAAPAAAASSEKPCASTGRISGEHAKKLAAGGAVLLDVRSPEEYSAEHLPNARNIPVDRIDARAGELSKDTPVVTYCKSGMRAHRAAEALKAQGYTVYELGGIGDWSSVDC